MKIDDIYEVLINEHDINGNGITRINSFVVFVKNGLKDELCLLYTSPSPRD